MPLDLRNPILEAFIQGSQEKKQAQQEQFQNELKIQDEKRKDAESARQEKQLQGYLKNLDSEHAHQEAQLQLDRNRNELNARNIIAKGMQDGSMRALTPGEQNSSPAGGIQIGDPASGGFVFDPRQFGTPQTALQNDVTRARTLGPIEAQQAGDKASAVTKAQTDITDPLERYQAVQKHQMEMEKQLDAQQATAKNLATTIEGHKAVARINGQYELDKARIGQMAGINTPEEWTQTITPYILGDAQKPLGNTPRDILLRNHITAAGMKEVTSKETEKLDGLHELDPLQGLMDEFITTAPKTKLGAAGELVLGKIPTTDLNNLKNRIRSMGGSVASKLDSQKGRMANQEIERVLAGLATPGQTVENAKKDVSLIKSRISSIALDGVLGGLPDKQKLLIMQQRGFDPSTFSIDFKGKSIPRYHQDSDGEWLVFDPKKVGYVNVK